MLVGHFSFGLIFFLLTVPAVVICILACAVFPPLAVVSSSRGWCNLSCWVWCSRRRWQSIFQAAVYMHTQDVHSEEFSSRTLSAAMGRAGG